MRVVVSGLIAQYPLGGVTWDYLQYVVGLADLGVDVYYLEDTGQWPYNPRHWGVSPDCTYNVGYLAEVMGRFGLADRWAYRFPWQSQWFGLPDSKRSEIVNSADLMINISCALARPDEYRSIRRLALIDSDPVFTQVKLARGQSDLEKLVRSHDVLFSFGESLSACGGYFWHPTRQPVVLKEWARETAQRPVFTTVMNWSSYKPVVLNGQTYGQKDVEFKKFMDLPELVAPVKLEIAVNESGKTSRTPIGFLAKKGWNIVNPAEVCPDIDSYRNYIVSSRAEWSVAKNGYVLGQPGWFSCRSACYLAAGRPVVVQNTGFSSLIPTGSGVVPFTDFQEAAEGIRSVESDYVRHSKAAREIAEQYFDSRRVLTRLVEEAMAVDA
jgi:hypothetical protein